MLSWCLSLNLLRVQGSPQAEFLAANCIFLSFQCETWSYKQIQDRPGVLTEQVTAGDATLGDGGLHGTDGRWEDVRLLEDLR